MRSHNPDAHGRIARSGSSKLLYAAGAATMILALGVAVDMVPVRAAAAPVTVLSNDFEDNTSQGWGPRASEQVAVSTDVAHGGSHSLLASGRTASWQGPARDEFPGRAAGAARPGGIL